MQNASSRPAAAGADGVLYLTVENGDADTAWVVGARVPAAVAAGASLHASMASGSGMGAMTRMAPLDRVAVPPRDSARFAPGGRHVMVEGLRRALAAGDSVPFVLVVRRGARADSLGGAAAVRAY